MMPQQPARMGAGANSCGISDQRKILEDRARVEEPSSSIAGRGFFDRPASLESLETGMQRNANILVAGVGGLGVPAALALARAGGCSLTLIDPDPVELSNLARQVIYRQADLGKPKAECAARHLRERFEGIIVEARVESFEARNAIALTPRTTS